MSSSKWKCKKCHCLISEESSDRLCDNCNMDLIAQNLAAELSQHEIHREDVEGMADNSLIEPEVHIEVCPGGEMLGKESECLEDKEEIVQVTDNDPWVNDNQSRKRKPPPQSDDSGEDEPVDIKKSDFKPEPMRTRAKQHDASAKHNEDDADKVADHEDGDEEEDAKGPVRRLTRKALSEIEKYRHPVYEPAQTKSRRTKQFKAKQVYKAPSSQACIYTSDYVFYKGRYYQTGDVVLLRDTHRPGDYFAQITSFLTDQYCHKCATIQWLLPTKQSPATGFDPRTYILGYLDETPRPLASLLPVMHLPSDYYKFYKSPYPPPTPDPLKKHYLWVRSETVPLDSLLES